MKMNFGNLINRNSFFCVDLRVLGNHIIICEQHRACGIKNETKAVSNLVKKIDGSCSALFCLMNIAHTSDMN